MFKKALGIFVFIIGLLIIYIIVAIPNDLPLFLGSDVSYSSPTWSKDGKRIFYIKDIIYWKVDFSSIVSSGITLGGATTPTKVKSYIMSMKPNGSGKKIIVKFIRQNPPEVSILNLAILPNGKELIFFLWAPGVEYMDPSLNIANESGIYKINSDGTNLMKLTPFGKITKAPELFVSPDGSKIAYSKERYNTEDWPGSVFSSWLIDINGQNNYMVCSEESHVIGWTKDEKLVIGALTDLEGRVRAKYEKGKEILYGDNVRFRILVYDFLSKRFDVKTPLSFKESDEILKNLGIQKKDVSISPDGNKKLFCGKESGSIYIEDIDGKNKKTLLKGKTH